MASHWSLNQVQGRLLRSCYWPFGLVITEGIEAAIDSKSTQPHFLTSIRIKPLSIKTIESLKRRYAPEVPQKKFYRRTNKSTTNNNQPEGPMTGA